jgi:hypothetical protein
VASYKRNAINLAGVILIRWRKREGARVYPESVVARRFGPNVSKSTTLHRQEAAGRHVSCEYIAHYDMNHSTSERREAFQNKVLHAFEAW